MDKWDIFTLLLKFFETKETGEYAVYAHGETPHLIEIRSLYIDVFERAKKLLMEIFDLEEKDIKNVNSQDVINYAKDSYRGFGSRDDSLRERTRIIIFDNYLGPDWEGDRYDNYVELGRWEGDIYEYCILRDGRGRVKGEI